MLYSDGYKGLFLHKPFRRKREPALNQLKPVDAVIVLKEPLRRSFLSTDRRYEEVTVYYVLTLIFSELWSTKAP